MTIRTLPPTAAPIRWHDLWNGFLGMFRGEKVVMEFEEGVKKALGIQHAFLVSSGKAAFLLALLALKEGSDRDEVVIPGYTCFSVPSVVLKAGLRVRLCDIDPETLDFDFESLRKSVTSRTLCVVPNHLFGFPSDLDQVLEIAGRNGAAVVEDAAQAMGGDYKGKPIGTVGDIGFFSLGRGKNITTGNGGIIITDSDKLARRISTLYRAYPVVEISKSLEDLVKVFLMGIFLNPRLYGIPVRIPFLHLGETLFYKDFPCHKMSPFQAGLMRGWKKKLGRYNRIRHDNAAAILEALPAGNAFRTVDGGREVVPLRFPIIARDGETRRSVIEDPRARELGIMPMYPTSISRIPELAEMAKGQECPNADSVAERLFTLPTHTFVTPPDIAAMAGLLRESSRRIGLQENAA